MVNTHIVIPNVKRVKTEYIFILLWYTAQTTESCSVYSKHSVPHKVSISNDILHDKVIMAIIRWNYSRNSKSQKPIIFITKSFVETHVFVQRYPTHGSSP